MVRFGNPGRGTPLNLLLFMRHLPDFIKLYLRLFFDRRVPLYLKAMLAGAALYFISPVDIIPEIALPLPGLADDAIIMIAALKYFIKLAPKDVVDEHVMRIEAGK